MIGGLLSVPALASDSGVISNPQIGVVLDAYYQNSERELSERAEGFGLGHTELNMSANIDDKFYGALTTVLESHGGETELVIEEAYIETLSLPAGFNVRAGRFLSDFGYLNNQHMHTDQFVERPAAYRSLLGSHYFDDGIRANVVLPTDLYVRLGIEALDGSKLNANETEDSTVGVYGSNLKLGGDVNESNSWQFGLSYLHNRNGIVNSFGHHSHDHDHDHDHNHGPHVTGEHLYGTDFVWKWAPEGNYKYQNFTLAAEYLYLYKLMADKYAVLEGAPDSLKAYYVSGVYQFSPSWAAGMRYGEAEGYHGHVHDCHDHAHGHFHDEKLKEFEVMLAWNSSHFGTIRGQYTRQDDGKQKDDIFTLQYVMTFGAHGAHAF
ncbi:hypothetical protein MD588_06980 [Photobacterium sp. SDRW27]|nr:hypothetical protein [Photobacterium obscurum]MCW8328548.1 hypothetical protein [Photobacterium obscurum]